MRTIFSRRAAGPWAVGLLAVAVGVVLAHEGHAPLPSKGAEVDVAKGHVTLSSEARDALDVESVEIGVSAPPDTVLAYATLATPWNAHGYAVSRLPGRIVALRARPGDRVEAGQVLAEVQGQELESLRLEIQAATTEAGLAEKVYKSQKGSEGSIPEWDIIAAEARLRQARNSLDLAKLKWDSLGLPKDGLEAILAGTSRSPLALPVRSPVAGTVIHSDLAVGKVVEPGEHLFEVIDLSTVWARIGVLEKDITRIVAGSPVEVRLTAYPGEPFKGKVAVVGQYLNPETHLNDVWAEFRNDQGGGKEPRLLPGMQGQARIELPRAGGTMTVPATALVNDGVDRFVLVEEAKAANVSEFRKRSVAVVRETPDAVEVRSAGLFPGDRVVARGSHELGTFFAPGTLRLTPETASTFGLKVEPVARHTVSTLVEVPGAVELPPDRRSVSTSRLAGTVLSIRVDRGQRVRAGAVLAEVFSMELLNLQLDLLREHLAADQSAVLLARMKGAKGSLSQRRVVEAEAASVSAANRRDNLLRRLELLGLSKEQLDALVKRREVASALPVRASVGGTIVSFDRVVGQSVRADEPLFEIHDLGRPWVQGVVSEQEHARVRIGQPARVRVVGDPGRVLEGKVSRSGRTFGASHRTLSVWVELDRDPPVPLRHNQMAKLSLVAEGKHAPSLAVPLGAVHREGVLAFVFVRKGDTFDRRGVVLGRQDDRFAEVVSGVEEGEVIAVTAADEINTAWASVR
ncbi:MAG: efflux RND transporter periplasmic adaptor subunit [Gemmataceae bacterium]|nr:efflux RND transporter periplasmic adaptor subunit [Gemmataceae bacterium]